MSYYEATFIVNQELTKKQIDLLIDGFSEILKSNGGKVVRREYWGIRNFAYPIKKQKRGYYSMLSIEADNNEVIQAIDKKMKTQEEVMRHLIIKVDNLGKEKSMLAKSNNNDS